MNTKLFFKIIWPFLLIESIFTASLHIVGEEYITYFLLIISFLFTIILPFLIGIRLHKNKANKLQILSGGALLSLASTTITLIIYSLSNTEMYTYIGVAFSYLIICILQSSISLIGAVYEKK